MARSARRIRETVRFFAGLAGLAYETVVDHSDRPVLLGVFAAMIGIDVIVAEIVPGGRRRTDPPA